MELFRSLSLSNKSIAEIELVHEKDGFVCFNNTSKSEVNDFNLKLISHTTHKRWFGKIIKKATMLWQGAVLYEILWYGFKNKGCICINGKKIKSRKQDFIYYHAISTIIQIDGDIICKISNVLLREKDANYFIEFNSKVIQKFFEKLNKYFSIRVRLIRVMIAITITILSVIKLLM